MRTLLLTLTLALAVFTPAAADDSRRHALLAEAVADLVVVPVYRRHALAMASLARRLEHYCAADDRTPAGAVRDAFVRAMDAWQRAQVVVFGPIDRGDGRARVQYWPDRRGTGTRQLERVLAQADPALLAPGALARKSVAVADLQALERALFVPAEGLVAPGRFRCRYAAAIARHQVGVAATLVDAWTTDGGFRQLFLSPGAGNDRYATASEAARDVLRCVVSTLETIVAVKLARPLGDTIDRARPKRAESWRSGQSIANIAANLETIVAITDAPGGLGDLLTDAGAWALASGLRRALVAAAASARAITVPMRDAVVDPEARAQLEALAASLRDLLALLTGPVSEETGILVGFNASDGD